MAVSKELLARYKELKAQGISVTLSELKAQMEAEENGNTPINEAPKPTGFAALSASEPKPEPVQTYNEPTYNQPQQESSWETSYYSQPEETKVETPVENYSSSFESAGSSMMQSSSIESYSYGSPSYSNPELQYTNNEPQAQYNYQEPQPSYTEPQQNYYHQEQTYTQSEPVQTYNEPVYQQPQQTYYQPEPQPTYEQPKVQQQYSGNVVSNNSVDTSSYNSNFNANFSWQAQTDKPIVQQVEPPKTKYTGNLPPQPASSFFGPSVVDNNTQTSNPIQNGKYCLIGYPLGHSLSSHIHNAGFKSLGIESEYEILETPPDDLVDRIKYLKYNGYAGFNVTIPLKIPVTLFLDTVDFSADLVGAVNTVVINQDKTLKGYNTDVIGFRNAIPSDFNLVGKTAGVLGTGGAARAAIVALAQSQVKEIKLYTRNIPNCTELLNYLRRKFPNITFNVYQIEYIRDLGDVHILVNTTPIGMQGRAADMTPVEEKELKTLPQGALVYDVIYNPKKTILLKLAERNGYRTINGIDMFIHQALAAQKIWTGKTPDFKDMKIAALENL